MLLKIKKNVDVSFQTRILEILDYCCVSGKNGPRDYTAQENLLLHLLHIID